jgi:formylmethanofuran dehydrogenase subunit E
MLGKDEKQALIEKIFAFHTKRAPGIAIGVARVDLALEKLGPVKDKLNAVCEGQSCLVDVLQNMTGCTYGNKYLRIAKDLGRFAFTLFDRYDGRGIRVYIDIDKIDAEKTPELAKFFTRTRSKEVKEGGPARAESAIKVMNEFDSVGEQIIAWYPVKVLNPEKPPMYPAAQCAECHESFLVLNQGETVCGACRGEIQYFVRQ